MNLRMQSKGRQAILDDPTLSEPVKRAMLRFWQKLDDLTCTCGAATEDKWSGIHEPSCAAVTEGHG